ncbi:MAG: hypothetical protein ACTSUF_10375 [Candidatus Heimdallarchaeaceae archaeon]
MNKLSIKLWSITTIIVIVFALYSTITVAGSRPIVSSRVSNILEIKVLTGYYSEPNKTLFGINTEVEILNRAEENQTVVELSDFSPKVFINASFVNQSLMIEQISFAHATIMYYSYPPGISIEYEQLKFLINQEGLSTLPDGNYTLWRPINTAYPQVNFTTAEALATNITVDSGIMSISYPNFTMYTIPELNSAYSLLIVVTVIFSFAIAIVRRRKIKTC